MERFHYPASNDDFVDACDLEALLHPSQAFEHPSEVIKHPDLTLNEKRAILASWASDACAIEAVPTLRCLPGGKRPVHFDEVMDALRALDEEARRTRRATGNHRVLGRRPLDGKKHLPKSKSPIAHSGSANPRGRLLLGAPHIHVAQRRMWL
jgi:hypothetical protein